VLVLVLLSLLGAVVLAAIGWLIAAYGDDGLPAADPARPDLGPVDRPIEAADVPALRFRLAFRGYRMSDVDEAMSALAVSLADAERRAASAPRVAADADAGADARGA
jgi:DivIVA domain-containing protein